MHKLLNGLEPVLFADLVVLIPVHEAGIKSAMRILNLPLCMAFIPAGFGLGIITMPTPRQQLAILADNHITIELAP